MGQETAKSTPSGPGFVDAAGEFIKHLLSFPLSAGCRVFKNQPLVMDVIYDYIPIFDKRDFETSRLAHRFDEMLT